MNDLSVQRGLIEYKEDLKDLYSISIKTTSILCNDDLYTKKRSKRLRKIAVLILRETKDVQEELDEQFRNDTGLIEELFKDRGEGAES